MKKTIHAAQHPLKASLTVPGDKSISHRAVMLGALSEGDTHVSGFLNGADCLSTIGCFRHMGIAIELAQRETEVVIHDRGLRGIHQPEGMLESENS